MLHLVQIFERGQWRQGIIIGAVVVGAASALLLLPVVLQKMQAFTLMSMKIWGKRRRNQHICLNFFFQASIAVGNCHTMIFAQSTPVLDLPTCFKHIITYVCLNLQESSLCAMLMVRAWDCLLEHTIQLCFFLHHSSYSFSATVIEIAFNPHS